MATNEKKATEKVAKTVATAPNYTVDEFAVAPQSVGTNSPDIVRAAFKVAGVTEATTEKAKEIVNKFKNKEVK